MTNAIVCLPMTMIVSSALSFSMETLPNPGYQLRPFNPKRKSDCASLEEICANVYGGTDYLPAVAASYAEDPDCSFLALTKNHDDKHNATAKNDTTDGNENILAVANYKRMPAQNSAWIEAVRTHPNHRNQGLASTLLRSLVEFAKQENDNNNNNNNSYAPCTSTNILTCTIRSNKGMLRTFDKVGFTQCNTIQLLSFSKCAELPGWKSGCEETPRPLLDALNLNDLVSPIAKKISPSSWRTISTEIQLLIELEQCKLNGGTSGYLPGMYEYIVPGRNRLDLKKTLEHGLALCLDLTTPKQTYGCETDSESGGINESDRVEQAILVFTQDERITSLKSKWMCSIVAHSHVAFDAALLHAHSLDVARRMDLFEREDISEDAAKNATHGDDVSSFPFILAFDDALPLKPGSLAHALPRVTDECVVYSYNYEESSVH
mmetsp:Transcript_8998/g.19008  ORF Transcript_8998/g.19008 Transcript_8998/m.19008 type:complete len:434 (-) Transcript_8998:935-2236(-)